MHQFFHSRPMPGVKGIRVIYHIIDGKCVMLRYLE